MNNKKYLLLFCVALIFVGCYPPVQFTERKPDYIDLQSYNIAGSEKYIHVVTREYVFTDEQSAKEFYTKIGGEEK